MTKGKHGGDGSGAEVALPPRLSSERSHEGDLVRRYLRRPHGSSEGRGWVHFEAALLGPVGRRSRAPRALAAVAGLAALAAVSWLLLGWPGRSPSEVAIGAPVVSPAPAARTMDRPVTVPAGVPASSRTIALGPGSLALAPGHWTIAGEASLELGPGSAARAERSPGGSPVVALVRGRIALAVVHRPRPAPFRVSAGVYEFTVLGTTFTVNRAPDRVDLVVSEGHVAVSRAGRRLAVVSAGGEWSSRITMPAARVLPPATEPPECAAPGSNRPGPAALPCLRAQAAGAGLRAQIALFHIGRINQEDLREPAGALATFEELRRRFPGGPLRAECDLSIVQLLAAAGRHDEALEESAALLARGASPERGAELRLLRGNLYREALGDLARAEHEYFLAFDPTSPAAATPAADEALYLHALSLEALGRRLEARDRYQLYLARERPAHAKEAREALLRLEQTSGASPGSN
jgi:ferric-dicitrate binding protein FerR (iron transport regulator)